MSLILNIDTTSETALLNIADTGYILAEENNLHQKDHAAFLHPAIGLLMKKTGIELNDLSAIAVCHGPGSYTGIRVGMSSAKGLCYTLNKPLILLNSLEVLTKDVIDNPDAVPAMKPVLYCPMIDARRMEVFTAVYDKSLNVIDPPSALILEQNSYVKVLLNSQVLFFGNGAAKWQQLCVHENALFADIKNKGLAMSRLSYQKLQEKDFSDIAYSEPFYLKEFYTAPNNT